MGTTPRTEELEAAFCETGTAKTISTGITVPLPHDVVLCRDSRGWWTVKYVGDHAAVIVMSRNPAIAGMVLARGEHSSVLKKDSWPRSSLPATLDQEPTALPPFTVKPLPPRLNAVNQWKLKMTRAIEDECADRKVQVVPTTAPGLIAVIESSGDYRFWSSEGRLVSSGSQTCYVAPQRLTMRLGQGNLPECTSQKTGTSTAMVYVPENSTMSAVICSPLHTMALWCSNLAILPHLVDGEAVLVPYANCRLAVCVGVIMQKAFCIDMPKMLYTWPKCWISAHAAARSVLQ